jgi:hypothetical protein
MGNTWILVGWILRLSVKIPMTIFYDKFGGLVVLVSKKHPKRISY